MVAPTFGLALGLLLAPAPAAPSGLAAAAAASGRPRECAISGRRAAAKGASIWEQARSPNLQRYCDRMARAQAQLSTNPEDAKASAAEADKLLPGRAAPSVVMARAALALQAVDEAEHHFERARALDPRSVEDAPTMHDLAKVLVKSGKREEALAVYRALVPRIDLLDTSDRRVSVLLEAAYTSMAVAASKGARLDEPIAYLREARQQPPTQLGADVLLSLVLVLDRSGDRAQADAALADAQRTGAKPRTGTLPYVASSEDQQALEALALEGAAAARAWEAYLAGPGGKGPWATTAKARLDALKKGGGRAKPASESKPKKGKPQ